MTISQAIVKFLEEYEDIIIETNHMKDGSDQYGLFKAPSRDKKENIDGSYVITEYYQFLASQKCISDRERKEADEWLEDLTYWVDDYSFNYGYPKLDKRRDITDISVTGAPCPMEENDRVTVFQISLSITYIREREDV